MEHDNRFLFTDATFTIRNTTRSFPMEFRIIFIGVQVKINSDLMNFIKKKKKKKKHTYFQVDQKFLCYCVFI